MIAMVAIGPLILATLCCGFFVAVLAGVGGFFWWRAQVAKKSARGFDVEQPQDAIKPNVKEEGGA